MAAASRRLRRAGHVLSPDVQVRRILAAYPHAYEPPLQRARLDVVRCGHVRRVRRHSLGAVAVGALDLSSPAGWAAHGPKVE
eukprot:4130877-Prymnesium_polylepis.2